LKSRKADFEVVADLFRRQRPVVDCQQAHGAGPPFLVVHLAADGEREGFVPGVEQVRWGGVRHVDPLAVDEDLAAVDGIVVHDEVLKGSLQDLVHRRRRELLAVRIVRVVAHEGVVVVQRLPDHEIARCRIARVGHYPGRTVLGDVGGCCPELDGELTGRGDQIVELGAGGGGCLGLAIHELYPPTADPVVLTGQGQVHGGFDAGGVIGLIAGPGLELVQRDQISLVTATGGSNDAVRQAERHAGHQIRIDGGDRYRPGEVDDRVLDLRGVARTVRPAVVRLLPQAQNEPRVRRIVQVDLGEGGIPGDVDVIARKVG